MKLADKMAAARLSMTFTDTACDCTESLPIAIMDSLKKIDEIESASCRGYLVSCLENHPYQPFRPHCSGESVLDKVPVIYILKINKNTKPARKTSGFFYHI